MHTNVSSGFGNGKHRNKEILQYLIPKVVHGLADPLAVGGLVARKARAALAVGNAREDALGQGERVGIVAFHAGAVYESGKGVSGRRVGATLIVALLGRHLVQGALSRSVKETSAADESAGTMAKQATAATKAFILF